MSTLGDLQSEFARCMALLILRINETPGYSCRYGEARRSDEQAEINALGAGGRSLLVKFIETKFPALAKAIANNVGSGIRATAHGNGLAVDLNLMKDGVYQSSSEAHAQFGAYWKTLHPAARWGGDFKNSKGEPKPDGNHYSFEFNGVK